MFITAAISDATSVYKAISIFGYSLAAVCLVLCIAIFFLYDIRGAYTFLTGQKQRKGIDAVRKNQEGGNKQRADSIKFGPSEALKRKKDKASTAAVQLAPPLTPAQNDVSGTAPLIEPPIKADPDAGTDVLTPASAAPAASAEAGTDVLTPVSQTEGGTEVLAPAAPAESKPEEVGGTAILGNNSAPKTYSGSFVLVKNEMLIHTDEVL